MSCLANLIIRIDNVRAESLKEENQGLKEGRVRMTLNKKGFIFMNPFLFSEPSIGIEPMTY